MNQGPNLQDQAYALAGVAQFARYAHDMAQDGRDLAVNFERAKQAIFCTDPDRAIDVFGSRAELADGIAYLKPQLVGEKPDDKSALVARYIGQILKLAGRVQKDEQALGRLRGAIDRARLAEDQDVAEIIDAAYRETISPMRPQIMLQGHPSYLNNEYLQQRIRTHLLAAIRAGVLWRQCGGGFMSLFLRRKALLAGLEDTSA